MRFLSTSVLSDCLAVLATQSRSSAAGTGRPVIAGYIFDRNAGQEEWEILLVHAYRQRHDADWRLALHDLRRPHRVGENHLLPDRPGCRRRPSLPNTSTRTTIFRQRCEPDARHLRARLRQEPLLQYQHRRRNRLARVPDWKLSGRCGSDYGGAERVLGRVSADVDFLHCDLCDYAAYWYCDGVAEAESGWKVEAAD